MAAGEDQTQSFIFDLFRFKLGWVFSDPGKFVRDLAQRSIEARTPSEAVHGLEASHRNKPGSRVGRHTFHTPLLHSRDECIMQGFLGEIEISQQTNERCK